MIVLLVNLQSEDNIYLFCLYDLRIPLSTAARRDCFADPFEDWPATKQHNNQQAEGGDLRFTEVDNPPLPQPPPPPPSVSSIYSLLIEQLIIITEIVLTLKDLMSYFSNLT